MASAQVAARASSEVRGRERGMRAVWRPAGSGAGDYARGAGRSERPIRYWSTPRGRAPALGDRPDDQRLAALHVARGEHPRHARHPRRAPPDVAALGEAHAELLEHPVALGPQEAHGQQGQVAGQGELRAGDLAEDRTAILARNLDPDRLEAADAAPRVAEEALRRDRVDALPALLVRRGDAVDVRVLGPRVVRRAPVGRPRQDLHLVDGARALAVHRAEAVRARVAAAEDHHVLVARRDEVRRPG